MNKKLYKLVRKEDGVGTDEYKPIYHKAGDVWKSRHTNEGSVSTLSKLEDRWASQMYHHQRYWGIPPVECDSYLGYRRANFEEQTTYDLVEVDNNDRA